MNNNNDDNLTGRLQEENKNLTNQIQLIKKRGATAAGLLLGLGLPAVMGSLYGLNTSSYANMPECGVAGLDLGRFISNKNDDCDCSGSSGLESTSTSFSSVKTEGGSLDLETIAVEEKTVACGTEDMLSLFPEGTDQNIIDAAFDIVTNGGDLSNDFYCISNPEIEVHNGYKASEDKLVALEDWHKPVFGCQYEKPRISKAVCVFDPSATEKPSLVQESAVASLDDSLSPLNQENFLDRSATGVEAIIATENSVVYASNSEDDYVVALPTIKAGIRAPFKDGDNGYLGALLGIGAVITSDSDLEKTIVGANITADIAYETPSAKLGKGVSLSGRVSSGVDLFVVPLGQDFLESPGYSGFSNSGNNNGEHYDCDCSSTARGNLVENYAGADLAEQNLTDSAARLGGLYVQPLNVGINLGLGENVDLGVAAEGGFIVQNGEITLGAVGANASLGIRF